MKPRKSKMYSQDWYSTLKCWKLLHHLVGGKHKHTYKNLTLLWGKLGIITIIVNHSGIHLFQLTQIKAELPVISTRISEITCNIFPSLSSHWKLRIWRVCPLLSFTSRQHSTQETLTGLPYTCHLDTIRNSSSEYSTSAPKSRRDSSSDSF